MASSSSHEASDFPSPQSDAPETPKEAPVKPVPVPEKQYRIYNTSGQTLYVVNSDGTHCLPPRAYLDLPFSKISYHIKLMARHKFINLYEKEEKS
jgi:hypothetical protein